METNPIPSTCWACDAPATRIADSTECADCGAFQTDAPTCECGRPSVNEIWNGMMNMPVCAPCWHDPENIAVEVTVQHRWEESLRERGQARPDSPTLFELTRDALVRRGRFDTAPTDIDALVDLISDRYEEWYS